MSRYAIAASRPWYRGLPARLKQRTGHDFFLIERAEELTAERLRELAPSKLFVPHWSKLIPEAVFGAFETIVFHMTDLPYGRGGSPLQNLIVRGHRTTKLSAIRCEAGLDTGPVYLKKDLGLEGAARDIFERATRVIEEMIVEIIEKNPPPVAQSGEAVVFARRTPADGDLAGAASLAAVYDQIRMLDADGYPHAFLEVGGLRFEFTHAEALGSEVRASVRITQRGKHGG